MCAIITARCKVKKADVVIGQKYVAKISGKLTVVRLDRQVIQGGWYATNVSTGRRVRIRTAARLRRAASFEEKLSAAYDYMGLTPMPGFDNRGATHRSLNMLVQAAAHEQEKEEASLTLSPQWPNATQRSRM